MADRAQGTVGTTREAPTHRARAVVIGLEHYIGLQTARILSARGVPVIGVMARRDHPHRYTRVCERMHFATTESDALIETLLDLGPQFEDKAVLYPCRDMSVLLISRHRSELASYYHVALPDAETVELLMYKTLFYRFALDEGLPIPRTLELRSGADAEEAARSLCFPCTLKPVLKTPEWEAHSDCKVFGLSTGGELLTHYEHSHKWVDGMVAQEWIPGGDDSLFACNCYFDRKGKPAVVFTSRSIRKWYPETGNTCLGQSCACPEVEEAALNLFRSVDYRGLGYLEMKRHADSGKYYIIEPNVGRPTGKSALADACGAELLYTMYCDQVGEDLPANGQRNTTKKWMHIRHDLQSAWVGRHYHGLTLKGWWRSVRGEKVYAVFSWSDPLPFLADIVRSFVRFFKGCWSRDITEKAPLR